MKHLVVAGSFAASILSNSAYSESHLPIEAACPDGEKIYFSCETTRSKLIRLCAAEVNGSTSSLSYFFGTIDNPELTQAASPENNFEPFRFNHYFRYGADYFRVSFVRGGYRYEIYKDYDMEETPAERSGIIVSSIKDASKEVDIECRGKASGSLSPLSSILKCDKDNALGCAN
ncbi:hypothetical protein [Stutzerimonas balearica]|uniref:hypothetical protein n=1 Tax=Stutzerimonas balearica TaxID=74829 RepID=UPI00289CE02F|nr:hypothetical protein [Stutzerimonas balearica]